MYTDKYYPMLAKDIEDCIDALSQTMPDSIRAGLETELRKLQTLNAALNGEMDKSQLHSLRANLRWARQKLVGEHDSAKRRKIEAEIMRIEAEISKEAERKDRTKEGSTHRAR